MSSPKAALRALALRCLTLLRFGFQAPSSIIHLRRVPAFSGPISASRDRCSASSVGPKPSNTGSRARFNARPRICDALARFERRPRSPWITTPSPARSHLLRSLRKWREVMPSNSAPRLAATSPCSTCFSTASRSRSRWLNVSISSPGSVCSLHSERTNSERGHFYFNQTGHFYFNATGHVAWTCPANGLWLASPLHPLPMKAGWVAGGALVPPDTDDSLGRVGQLDVRLV